MKNLIPNLFIKTLAFVFFLAFTYNANSQVAVTNNTSAPIRITFKASAGTPNICTSAMVSQSSPCVNPGEMHVFAVPPGHFPFLVQTYAVGPCPIPVWSSFSWQVMPACNPACYSIGGPFYVNWLVYGDDFANISIE